MGRSRHRHPLPRVPQFHRADRKNHQQERRDPRAPRGGHAEYGVHDDDAADHLAPTTHITAAGAASPGCGRR